MNALDSFSDWHSNGFHESDDFISGRFIMTVIMSNDLFGNKLKPAFHLCYYVKFNRVGI